MEDTSGKWHGVGKFDVETGKIINNHKDGYISLVTVFKTLTD